MLAFINAGTLIILDAALLKQPTVVVVVNVTLCAPEVINTCTGFCNVDVFKTPLPGSSKFQAHL